MKRPKNYIDPYLLDRELEDQAKEKLLLADIRYEYLLNEAFKEKIHRAEKYSGATDRTGYYKYLIAYDTIYLDFDRIRDTIRRFSDIKSEREMLYNFAVDYIQSLDKYVPAGFLDTVKNFKHII